MSDRRKLQERERKVSVALFVALTLMPRPSGRADRAWFMAVAREIIPDLTPDVAEAALRLSGHYSDADCAAIVAACPPAPTAEPEASDAD